MISDLRAILDLKAQLVPRVLKERRAVRGLKVPKAILDRKETQVPKGLLVLPVLRVHRALSGLKATPDLRVRQAPRDRKDLREPPDLKVP